MRSITINSVGDTYISTDSRDEIFVNSSNRFCGLIYKTTSSIYYFASGYSTIIYFPIPHNLTSANDCVISKVYLTATKQNAKQSTYGSDTITDYSGVLMTYDMFVGASTNNVDKISYNQCKVYTTLEPDSYDQTNILSANSVLSGEQFTCEFPASEDWSDLEGNINFGSTQTYLILKLNGYRTGAGGTYYYDNLFPNRFSLTIEYGAAAPIVSITSAPSECYTSDPATIKWNYSSELGLQQTEAKIYYRQSGQVGPSQLLATVTGSATEYVIPANTFNEAKNITLYVSARASNGELGTSKGVIISYKLPNPTIALADYQSSVNYLSPTTVSWTYKSPKSTAQAHVLIQKLVNGNYTTYADYDSDNQYYDFPAKSLTVGDNSFRITVKDANGYSSQSIDFTINCYKQVPVVTVGYPNNITVSSKNTIIFTWQIAVEVEVPSYTYKLQYSTDNWVSNTEITTTTPYYSFVSNTFPTGSVSWKVKGYDGYTWSAWSSIANFEAVGETSAPVITSVTNNTTPTITWTVENQDCFEVNLRDSDNNLIYQSQLQIGSTTRTFKAPVMLQNGFYSAEVRALNTYGIYTAWGTKSFQINLSAPSAPTLAEAYVENDYSVTVDGQAAVGVTTYVVRRDDETEEVEIIAKYIGNPVKDYTASLCKTYSYTLRSVGTGSTAGYTDGAWTQINISLDGHVLLHDAENKDIFVDLFKSNSEDWNVQRKDSYNKSFHFTIGRVFPVVERTEWNSSTRTFTAYATDKELEILNNIHNKSVYYRSEGEAFLADMTLTIGNEYINGGKMVSISLTRLEENEVSVL